MDKRIYVKFDYGKMIEIMLPKGFKTTILEVNALIQNKMQIKQTKKFHLFYHGKLLREEGTLSELRIVNHSTIYLEYYALGGGWFHFCLPDINQLKEKEFVKTAPVFRTVISGLNLDAYCDSCKEYVVIQIGYNKKKNEFFDIGRIGNFLKF